MRRWVALAGITISLVLLAVMLQRVNLADTAANVRRLGWGAWLLGAAIYLTAFVPRGMRWKLMFPESPRLPLGGLTQTLIIGYAANNVLPFRLGEVVRSYVAGDRYKLSKLTCLGTIASEKVLDGCCLLGMLAASLPFIEVQAGMAVSFHRMLAVAVALFGAALGGCCVLALFDKAILAKVRGRFGPGMVRLVESGIGAVAVFKNGGVFFKAAALTLIIWLIEGSCFVFFMSRLGIDHPWPKGIFCLGIVNLSILIPSAPGYVGVFQAGAIAAFLAMGLGSASGLSLGILTHAAQFIPTTLLGLAFAMAMGLSWKGINKLKESQ